MFASLRVEIDGRDAVASANQVTKAVTEMGAAAEDARAKTANATQNFSASTKAASDQVVYLGANATAAARAAAGANAVILPAAVATGNAVQQSAVQAASGVEKFAASTRNILSMIGGPMLTGFGAVDNAMFGLVEKAGDGIFISTSFPASSCSRRSFMPSTKSR
ncbi:MAG TPA: hypothetical protein VN857_13130 [Chthoniobacterales bacterium]|nr:hypothetical protein [Chthoniobacterales bacterium]